MSLQVILACLLSVCLLILSFKLLLSTKLIAAWLRASFGMLLMVSSLLMFFLSVTLSDFSKVSANGPIATVTCNQISEQSFQLIITRNNGPEIQANIHGDAWQIDARVLAWHGGWRLIGLDTYYQFERLSGRYHKIEDERSKPRSLVDLRDTGFTKQLPEHWLTLSLIGWLPEVESNYGSSAYVPCMDQAQYSLSFDKNSLIINAENAAAKAAVSSWL